MPNPGPCCTLYTVHLCTCLQDGFAKPPCWKPPCWSRLEWPPRMDREKSKVGVIQMYTYVCEWRMPKSRLPLQRLLSQLAQLVLDIAAHHSSMTLVGRLGLGRPGSFRLLVTPVLVGLKLFHLLFSQLPRPL